MLFYLQSLDSPIFHALWLWWNYLHTKYAFLSWQSVFAEPWNIFRGCSILLFSQWYQKCHLVFSYKYHLFHWLMDFYIPNLLEKAATLLPVLLLKEKKRTFDLVSIEKSKSLHPCENFDSSFSWNNFRSPLLLLGKYYLQFRYLHQSMCCCCSKV